MAISVTDDMHLEEQFDDYLDEMNPPIAMGGVEYSMSYTWKQVDPIAYRIAFAYWRQGIGDEKNS